MNFKMKQVMLYKPATIRFLVIFGLLLLVFNFLANYDFTVRLRWKRDPRIVNRHDYSYVLNPRSRICKPAAASSGDVTTLLVAVPSEPANFAKRQAVRNTWANPVFFGQVRLVFMLGTTLNASLNERVRKESAYFNDIVQEDFIDAYKNLTLKTIMIMKWTAEYCSNARFVLKIDDDVIMHTKKVREYLSALGGATSNQFHCLVVWWPQPISEDAKWFMSKDDEYSALLDHYPKYCDSPAYMFSIDLAGRLFNASLYQKKLLRLEDVSMGMLAEKLNASFVDIRSAYYFDQWSLVDFARNHSMRDFFFLYTFSHNSQYPGHFNQTWSLVVNQFT